MSNSLPDGVAIAHANNLALTAGRLAHDAQQAEFNTPHREVMVKLSTRMAELALEFLGGSSDAEPPSAS